MQNNTQVPPAELFNLLKDNNKTGKKNGDDINVKQKEEIDRESLVEENKPQSRPKAEDTYGMNLFRSGVVASISELSTPPLDYPIGVSDQIIVSMWNGAEATLE